MATRTAVRQRLIFLCLLLSLAATAVFIPVSSLQYAGAETESSIRSVPTAGSLSAGQGFRFPVRDRPGWWEGWWTRSQVFQAVLREGIALLNVTKVPGEESLEIGPVEGADFLLWIMAGVRLTDPFTFLQAEFPQITRVEIENSGFAGRQAYGSLPRWLKPPDPGGGPGELPSTVHRDWQPFENSDNPLVLVYHTHATESFTSSGEANEAFSEASDANIVRAGRELAWTLQQQYGVPTFHLTEMFDQQGRESAYARSEAGVRRAMQENPSLKILLDIHRDSVPREATTIELRGVTYARVLLVLGTNRRLQHDNWRQNQAWMAAVGQQLEESHPGLLRKLKDQDDDDWTFSRPDRYNQHLSPGAALIEIGGPENTMEEVLRTAQAVAGAVSALIKQGRYPH